jgi:hypothetical protein
MNLLNLRRRTPLTVESFHFVPATSDHALVRVRGSWRRAADRPATPVLVTDQGGVVQRFAALPDPETRGADDLALWRAAFALPLELLREGGASYHLEGPTGRRVELPAPVPAPADGPLSQEREPSLSERRRVSDRRLRRDRRRQAGAAPLGKERRVRQRRRDADRRRRRSQAELKAFADRVGDLRGQVEELKGTRRQFESRMNELEAEVERHRSASAQPAQESPDA